MKKILGVLIPFFITVTPFTYATNLKIMQSFETVWQTINDKHIDRTFGGLDWSEVHD